MNKLFALALWTMAALGAFGLISIFNDATGMLWLLLISVAISIGTLSKIGGKKHENHDNDTTR